MPDNLMHLEALFPDPTPTVKEWSVGQWESYLFGRKKMGRPKGKATPKPVTKVKPITPTQCRRELEALEFLYEHSTLSDEAYDTAKAHLMAALELFGKE